MFFTNSGTKKYWICSFDSAIIYLYGVSRLSAAAGEWFRGELPQYGCVRTIQLSDSSNTVDRALTMIPELVEKVSALLNKKEAPAAPAEEKPQP